MDAHQLLDGKVIRHRKVLVAEFSAQNVAEQPTITVVRYAVEFVVRRHYRTYAGLAHPGLEWCKEVFAHRPLRIVRRSHVGSAFGLAMHGKMLESRVDVVGVD